MYVVVVGAGEIGSQVVDLLTAAGHEVVVIEQDPDVADAIAREYDCLVHNADATVKENLENAGADRADAIITTTEEDAVNIMVLLLAEELAVPSKVSVVQNHEHMNLFRQVGANVVENPQRLIGEYLVRAVQRPSIKDFMTLAGDAEVFEITVVEGASIAGYDLREADREGLLGSGVIVVAVERDDETLAPSGDTTIRAGDLVTVFSQEGVTDRIMSVFADEGTPER